MFRGVTRLSLDGKGRLAVPVKHREALSAHGNGRLVLTADRGPCLLLYPQPEWEPIQQKLEGLSAFNPDLRKLQRLLLGYAEDVEMDTAGRILISPALRSHAQLDKHVMLVGQGRKLELWNDEKWAEETSGAFEFRDGALPSELDGFSL
jgi:MraZ protein